MAGEKINGGVEMSVRYFIAASLLLMALPGFQNAARAADYPKVIFEYADLYDRFCADVMKKTVEREAVEELETRIGEFRAEWEKQAPTLLKMTVRLTGAPFDYAETKAALSLCNPGSLSFPLIINARPYLKSINGGDAVQPLDKFVATVFHENLHRYVNDRKARLPDKTTPLLEKYKNEPAPVRNHIHLFAVYDEVYRRLGRQKDLEQIMTFEKTSNSAAVFKRAREIIAAEGTANVICEISKRGCRNSAQK